MDADEPREILLRTPWGGPWRRFSNPVKVIAATDPARVRDALRQVDAEVGRGRYAAGFVTYEAAAAFGLSVRGASDGLPHLCFGIFEAENVEQFASLQPLGRAGASASRNQRSRLPSSAAVPALTKRAA